MITALFAWARSSVVHWPLTGLGLAIGYWLLVYLVPPYTRLWARIADDNVHATFETQLASLPMVAAITTAINMAVWPLLTPLGLLLLTGCTVYGGYQQLNAHALAWHTRAESRRAVRRQQANEDARLLAAVEAELAHPSASLLPRTLECS